MYYLFRIRMLVEASVDHSEGSFAQFLHHSDILSLNFPIVRQIDIPLKIQNVNP